MQTRESVMKKIILIIFMSQFLYSDYLFEEYEMIWEYDRTGDVVIRVVKTPLNITIDVCRDHKYMSDDCIKMTAEAAISFRDILSRGNAYYKKFKDIEGEVSESVRFEHNSYSENVKFEKTLTHGFRLKLTSDSGSWFYMNRKEADYISKSLKDSEKISKFFTKSLESCID